MVDAREHVNAGNLVPMRYQPRIGCRAAGTRDAQRARLPRTWSRPPGICWLGQLACQRRSLARSIASGQDSWSGQTFAGTSRLTGRDQAMTPAELKEFVRGEGREVDPGGGRRRPSRSSYQTVGGQRRGARTQTLSSTA